MSTIRTRAAIALLGLGFLFVGVAPASAAAVPFTDPNATSSIGLCDAQGNPITSGSIDSHAFVTAAQASSSAPDGYGPDQGAKATLYAFQPRQDVDPGEWSGFQLSGSSWFADAAHPMASGTNLDPSLREFTSSYPVKWDGLLQLRLYYSAPNKVMSNDTYPAAVLRVTGNTWTVVQGASLHCDLSKVMSSERVLLPTSAFNSKHPLVTHAPPPSGAVTQAAGATAGVTSSVATPSAGSTGSSAPSIHSTPVADASTKSSKTSSSGAWWGLVVLAVVGAGGAFAWRRLRTR